MDVSLSSSEETVLPLLDVDGYVAREYLYSDTPGKVKTEVTQDILDRANDVIVVKLGFAQIADVPTE